MTCLSTSRKTILEARKAQKEAELTAYYAAIIAAIPNAEVAQYEFDSGEGRQKLWRRSPLIIQQAIRIAEKEYDQICKKLDGTGLSRVTWRRGP